jgi:hypothetical protein
MKHDTEVEQAHSLSPVAEAVSDSRLAAAQFEAIIRAWKGETVEGAVPASPVGEADWDGSRGLGQMVADEIHACTWTWLDPSYLCTPFCDPYASAYCTILNPSCYGGDQSTCQYG